MPKRTSYAPEASRRAIAHARALIEQMLAELERGLANPEHCAGEAWEKLFGAKQSMVVSVQKLVAALAALPECAEEEDAEKAAALAAITPEEMKLLKAWLAEGVTD